MKPIKLLINLLCLCTLPAQGVEIFSRQLNSDNGLPDNNVRFLTQDAKGFIWMGTPNGLHRYDGYFFTTYKYAETGNAQHLNNNHITGIHQIPDDRLLICEQGNHYSIFDINLNRFIDAADEYKSEMYEACRKRDVDEKLTAPYKDIIAQGGDVITDNLGNQIVLDDRGRIWFIDRKTGETISMHVFEEALFPVISSKKYKVITSEKHQLIWVSTNGCGITVYDRKNKTEQHIRQNSGLISTDYIIDMCMDQDENIWVADEFNGLEYLTTAEENGSVMLLDPTSKLLRSNQVSIIRQKADGTLILANTLGQVYSADPQLNLSPKPIHQGVDIRSVCYDQEGRPWIGSRLKGLRTGDGQWYAHSDSDPSSLSANHIFNLLCDRKGRIWVATNGGHLELTVKQQDGTYSFRHFFDKDFSAKVLYEDSHGIIWAGTGKGLYRFDPDALVKDTAAFEQILSAKDLNYSDVSSIYEDSRKQIWVGTVGNGIYFIDNTEDADGHAAIHQSNSIGLISLEVQSIIEDSHGVLWIATKKGITRYHPEERKIDYLYDEYNLMRNYYSENCACRLSDGRLVFGTNAGIVVYDSNDSRESSHRDGRLSITDILINGIPVGQMDEDSPLDRAPGNIDELKLSHDQNSLTVRFSSFNFNASASTRYAYYLEGYDKNWSEPTAFSFASYKNLPPGTYVLHIKAYGNHTLSDQEQTLTIRIARPWWNTWLAWLIYLCLAAGLGYAVYRYLRTVYNLRQRISIEKQLTEYKLQFFTNISHEFRTPLTIIRGAMERIKGQSIPAEMRQPVSSMDKSVNRMLRLINQLLEFRKMQNDKLRLALEETDVVKFLKDIFQNFWDIADNKHINYSFTTQERSKSIYVDRSHLNKIFYNILSNAFKYTPSHGDIKMKLSFDDDKMTVRIEDTGVGVPKEKQGELFQRFMQSSFSNNSIGIGLNLTKALVDVHHGTIRFEPNLPKGSVFIVELPTAPGVYGSQDFLLADHKLLAEEPSQPVGDYQELAPQPMNDRDILIVEDDSDVMDFLRNTMQHYFVVHTAMDGVEALNTLETLRPELIISDVMMPLMDGMEFTSRIRANEDLKDIPIILLTALTSDEKRIKGVEQGADAYITKPFDTKLLITTAIQLIQQRDMLKNRYMQKTGDVKAAPPEIISDKRDKRLLDTINLWLSDHISNPLLSVDDLAEAMGYSRTVFYKKMKALTGQTPADYIKTIRMNRAAEMLKDETITVAEVCYKVGISDPHYFAKVFKQQFGVSPKKYQQGEAPAK